MKSNSDTGVDNVNLFDLNVDNFTLDTAADRVLQLASASAPHSVVTPNVDHFIRWQRDPSFQALYANASMKVLDGMPLVWLSRLATGVVTHRITGIDLFTETCRRAAARDHKVAIVGGAEGVAERAAAALRATYPGLDVCLTRSPNAAELESLEYVAGLAGELEQHGATITALCLGSPKQERLFEDLSKNGATGAFLCVGAAVDFWGGSLARAPKWMQRIGAEWVFRLALEPKRLAKRYLIDDAHIFGYFLKAFLQRGRSLAARKGKL